MEFSLSRTVSMLERTPAVLTALLAELDDQLTHHNYGEGTWSAYEVVGHLLIGEYDDWIPRLRIILDQGTARPFDPFPHDATISPVSGRSLDDLLEEFAGARAGNLDILAAMHLTDAHWTLRGVHPGLGEVTLAQLLAAWATHDVHHVRQVCRAVAHQSRELVGPWRNYINTLPRE
ncbi:MAG: DinB family protein [Planctomycetota bacterium]|nr:MAG: DinB family protein [Planctomycetota bacterium]